MPQKWADYLITHVRYSKDNSHIEKVRMGEDKGDKLSSTKIYSREEVVSKLENHYTIKTAPPHLRGGNKLKEGEQVRPISVQGRKYLRTDSNHKASDNLGKLPLI